ncbi:class I tRNA ligase family protein, partial [Staphylococcus epidermidis]|nr:class I tRNA ligase family protein [Staphylococcus epidermidis]
DFLYEDVQGAFYHFKYPYADGNGYIEIATTRPETMLGDTAIVVNPNDERYKDVIGKTVILPIVGRELPILADEYVDIEFGSGAMKVTPAHDPNDFEIGQRHQLENIIVMDEYGKMNDKADKYKGMDRFDCRNQLVKDLKEQYLVIKIEEHTHSVGHSERSGAIVEPYLSTQWFVKMKPLAQRALDNQNTKDRLIFSRVS